MSKLRDAVRQRVSKQLGRKTRLLLQEKRIDTEAVNTLRQYFGTRSMAVVLERALLLAAVEAMADKPPLFDTLSFDKLDRILTAVKSHTPRGYLRVNILHWVLLSVATGSAHTHSQPEELVNEALGDCCRRLSTILGV